MCYWWTISLLTQEHLDLRQGWGHWQINIKFSWGCLRLMGWRIKCDYRKRSFQDHWFLPLQRYHVFTWKPIITRKMPTLHSLLFVLPFICEQRKNLDKKISFRPHYLMTIKYHKPDKWQWLEMIWKKKRIHWNNMRYKNAFYFWLLWTVLLGSRSGVAVTSFYIGYPELWTLFWVFVNTIVYFWCNIFSLYYSIPLNFP